MQWKNVKQTSQVVVLGSIDLALVQQLLTAKPAKVTIYDPDGSRAAALQPLLAQQPSIVFQQQAVAADAGTVDYQQYNLSQLNSFAPATAALKTLFPGLKLLQSSEISVCSVKEVLSNLQLKGNEHVLVLAQPAVNGQLFSSLAEQGLLNHFSYLVLLHGAEPFYQGMLSLQQLQQACLEQGFSLESQDDGDPDFPVLQFYRDQQAMELKQCRLELQKLSEQLKTQQEAAMAFEQQKSELTKQLELVTQQSSELAKQLQEEQSAHKVTSDKLTEVESWFQGRKKQALELEEQLKLAQVELATYKNQQVTQESMQALKATMETMFQQQAQHLQQAANALGQHVSKTQLTQQSNLQHFLSLQHSIEHGAPLLELDSWSMPADTLNQLAKLLQQTNYDMIIEFGAGQSTLVMAKTLINRNSTLKSIAADPSARNSSTVTADIAQYHGDDLPARIISFEQNEHYLQKTRFNLAQQGLESMVELVLAPLVPMADVNGQSAAPLFYDCMPKLQMLKSYLPSSNARILVVVDGPASPGKDPLARFPALTAILACYSSHKLDLLLDDSLRDGEQQVLARWQQLCEQRGLSMQRCEWPSHKGATLVRVNP